MQDVDLFVEDLFFYNFLQYDDRISYDGSSVDRMDDDYDDFFNRQDISEGKDDDEDKDIPSVSLSFLQYKRVIGKIWFSANLKLLTFWYSQN